MISNAEYQMMLARTARVIPIDTARQHTGLESELHDQIAEYCKGRGWPYVHSRMDRPSTQQKGVCDFIIGADSGRTYWIEAKRKNEKPTTEQLGFIAWLKKNGHRATVVWSYQEFLDFVNQNL